MDKRKPPIVPAGMVCSSRKLHGVLLPTLIRSRSRSPRRDDARRGDSRGRSPGAAGGGGARKTGVAGRWNDRGEEGGALWTSRWSRDTQRVINRCFYTMRPARVVTPACQLAYVGHNDAVAVVAATVAVCVATIGRAGKAATNQQKAAINPFSKYAAAAASYVSASDSSRLITAARTSSATSAPSPTATC